MTVARVIRNLATLAACAALISSAAACGSSPTGPSSTAPYSQTDVLAGSGTAAVAGNTVSVNYTGWLYDPAKPDFKGLQFDTSIGKDPFAFVLGIGQVVNGFDLGVVGMQIGGVRRLVIPPSLGYGAARSGPIPPSATLVFDIQLISVQ
ncbi:MAG: FKBP-type peptidyl-prolyl cis-trans isomerase [Acidobacteriota bacterium]